MTISISLLFDKPDGTQKQWHAEDDPQNDRVVLRYGAVGRATRRTIIPSARFKHGNGRMEVMLRADAKRREGYYDNPHTQTLSEPSHPSPGQSSEPRASKRESVLAALGDDDGPDWFF